MIERLTSIPLLRHLLPRPVRPIRGRALLGHAIPLVVLTVLVLGGAWALSAFRVVYFAAPWWFALWAVAPWMWWLMVAGTGQQGRARGIVVLTVRLLLVAMFAAVLARPQAVRESDRLAVVYAVDLSDSVGEAAVKRALEYVVRTAAEKPEQDAAGLVVFGREAGVELPPLESFPFEAINVQVPRDGTDLEKGLRLAAALCPENRPGRIVLISDGSATGGSVDRLLDELNARDLAVDVVPIAYDFDREVWVERIDLPELVKRGETYEAAAIISAQGSGEGRLLVSENGKAITTIDVRWKPGKNRVVIPIYLREPGYYDYEATLIPKKGTDGWRENNTAVGGVHLSGQGRILVIVDPAGEAEDHRSLVRALRESGREVEVVTATDVPGTAMRLLPYHAAICVNVPAEEFLPQQMQALRDGVFHFGMGFVMVGGQNSFGAGGYQRTDIEELLPVEMEIKQRRVMPKGAMAVVLHTCEFANGNTWAKRITKQAVSILSTRDEVGVLGYDFVDGDGWIVPFGVVKDHARVTRLVNGAEIGDMPSFDPCLQLAYQALLPSDASVKHMIVISDGDPSPPSPGLLQKFAAAGISITTVAVFPHAGGIDQRLMRNIARVTGGRFYFPKKASALPKIFIKEAKTLKRALIVNREVIPRTGFPSSIMKGIDTMPPLHGFVLTTAKDRAELILGAEIDEQVEPLLVAWRFGVGRSAAFTSDLASRWGRDWLSWKSYRAFVDQLVGNVARVDRPTELTARAVAEGGEGVVNVVDSSPEGGTLDLRATIRVPDGKVETIVLEQTGPRLYQGKFPLAGKGRYQINVAGMRDDRAERAMATLALAYSAEYLRFRADPIELERIATRTGGRMLDGSESGRDIFPADRPTKRDAQPIFDWMLLILACMVPLDVAVRRVQISPSAWFRRRERASVGTLEALKKRKDEIRGPSDAKRAEWSPPATRSDRPVSSTPEDEAAAPSSDPTPAKRPTDAPTSAADDLEGLSTTERLLAMKRRRQEEREDE